MSRSQARAPTTLTAVGRLVRLLLIRSVPNEEIQQVVILLLPDFPHIVCLSRGLLLQRGYSIFSQSSVATLALSFLGPIARGVGMGSERNGI